MVDIRTGTFDASILQAADWQASANKTLGPFQIVANNGWYALDLTSAKGFINKSDTTANGLTQIRLRFQRDDNNNNIANYLSIYSGNAAAPYRPQLVIIYHLP